MNSIIFITGVSFTAKCVVAEILSNFNYIIIKLNTDEFCSKLYGLRSKNAIKNLLVDKINASYLYHDTVVIIRNYNDISFILDELYPHKKLIVCMHNPIGFIFNDKVPSSLIMEKIDTYIKYYNHALLNKSNHIIRLEELLYDTLPAILNLVSSISVDKNANLIYKTSLCVKEVVMFHCYYQRLCEICNFTAPTPVYKKLTQLLINMKYIIIDNNIKYPIDYTNLSLNLHKLESSRKLYEVIPTNKIYKREYNEHWRIYVPPNKTRLKIAVCISGQPRFVDGPQYNTFKFNILDRYDCDVFCHYWLNEDEETIYETSPWSELGYLKADKDVKNKIQKLYNPVASKCDHVMIDNIDAEKYPETSNKRTPYNLTSMYTSMKKSYELLKDHVDNYGIKYDFVIRYRYDSIFDFFPNLYMLPKNNIYYSNLLPKNGIVSNNGCIIPYMYAESIFTIVDRLDILYNYGTYYNDEQMCWANLWYMNLLPRLVKLPTNIFHPSFYRPNIEFIDRRPNIDII